MSKRIDPRGRPSGSILNRLIDAVDRSNKTLTSLGGGAAAPTIYKAMSQEAGYADADYAVRCDADYYSAGANGYHLLSGAVPKAGVTHGWEQGMYSRAHHLRHFDRNGPVVYIDGYGWIDRSNVQGSDFVVGGSGNTLDYISRRFCAGRD